MSTKTFIPSRFLKNSGSGSRELPDTDTILGLERTSIGGGSGNWRYIDRYGNNVTLSSTYFMNNPIFRLWLNSKYTSDHNMYINVSLNTRSFKDYYIYIPPFFIKTENSARYWIAPYTSITGEPIDSSTINYYLNNGFRLHPAFYCNNVPLHEKMDIETSTSSNTVIGFWVSQYMNTVCSDEETGKSYNLSLSKEVPDDVYTIENYESNLATERSDYEEKTGREGYFYKHIMSIYEYSAIQLLSLFYNHTTYVETTDDDMYKQFYDIYGLYNSRWQYIKGLYLDSNKNLQIYTSGMFSLEGSEEDGFAMFPKDIDGYSTLEYKLPESVYTNKIYPKNVDNTIISLDNGSSNNIFIDGVDHYISLNEVFLPLSTTDFGVSSNYYEGTYSDSISFDGTGVGSKYMAFIGGSYYENKNTNASKDNGIFAMKFSNSTRQEKDGINLLGIRTCKILV